MLLDFANLRKRGEKCLVSIRNIFFSLLQNMKYHLYNTCAINPLNWIRTKSVATHHKNMQLETGIRAKCLTKMSPKSSDVQPYMDLCVFGLLNSALFRHRPMTLHRLKESVVEECLQNFFRYYEKHSCHGNYAVKVSFE